jgi:hypothetical protein
MDENSKFVLSIVTLAAAVLMIFFGMLQISFINNGGSGGNALGPLATLELVAAGSVILPLGWVGMYRCTSGAERAGTQAAGLVLGIAIFGGGLYWEAVTTSYVNSLTLYGATPVIFAGLALLALSLNSLLLIPNAGLVPDGRAPTGIGAPTVAGSTIPPESQFCPFCGNAMTTEHKFCRRCGRPVA